MKNFLKIVTLTAAMLLTSCATTKPVVDTAATCPNASNPAACQDTGATKAKHKGCSTSCKKSCKKKSHHHKKAKAAAAPAPAATTETAPAAASDTAPAAATDTSTEKTSN